LWFTKIRRAQNDKDFERWEQGGVHPTLNTFDNGDTRSVALVIGIQNTVIGRSDNAGPDGKGHTEEKDPMFTIDTTSPHAVAIVFDSHIEKGDNNMPMLLRMREGKPGGGKGPLISDNKSLTIATGNDQTLYDDKKVRRLLPLECERLQGFPDGWTEGQADTQRYKQIGNAVAVPVVEWIVGQLVDYDKQTRP
jgi:site-specific DNA-cytosine methylase